MDIKINLIGKDDSSISKSTRSLKDFAETELKKVLDTLEHVGETPLSAKINVKVRNNGKQKIELLINTDKSTYKRVGTGEDYYSILPYVSNEMRHAIYNRHDKKHSKIYRNKTKNKQKLIDETYQEHDSSDIVSEIENIDIKDISVRERFVDATPMSISEAFLRMQNLGYNFFLYLDIDTDLPSVVYSDKNYLKVGVIQLEENR